MCFVVRGLNSRFSVVEKTDLWILILSVGSKHRLCYQSSEFSMQHIQRCMELLRRRHRWRRGKNINQITQTRDLVGKRRNFGFRHTKLLSLTICRIDTATAVRNKIVSKCDLKEVYKYSPS